MEAFKQFFKLESAGGILLFSTAVLAVLCENTSLKPFYDLLLSTPVEIRIGNFEIAKQLILWINDGLMAVFFLLVGLEVKREFVEGELSSLSQIALPGIAAVGGMVAPALVYLFCTGGNPEFRPGWAIPTATDIAFALGVLSLFGSRIPSSAKIFLTAIAIFDDLGAIVVIAIFYTTELSSISLLSSALFLTGLFTLNRARVISLIPYLILGSLLWASVLKSGVHATLAGVALAFAIPMYSRDKQHSPVHRLEHALHPWVAFAILPLFAFGNAGVSLKGFGIGSLSNPVALGVIAGLVAGKTFGVFGFSWLAVKLGLARLPSGASWLMLIGIAALTGIGFTMSLFIGGLAFPSPEALSSARLAIVVGSLLSGVIGICIIATDLKRSKVRVN